MRVRRPSRLRLPTCEDAAIQSLRPRTARIAVALAVVVTACTGTPAGSPTSPPTGAAAVAGSNDPDRIRTDVGVSTGPCPDAVNPDNGCIHLGMLVDGSDGPGGHRARRVAQAQVAFWDTENTSGGIADHDVDVRQFNAVTTGTAADTAAYSTVRDEVLALAHVSGPETVMTLLDKFEADQVVAIPATTISDWVFADEVAETGSSACVEAMNAVDYAVERIGGFDSVMVVHPDDLVGRDTAAGVHVAADAHNLLVADVEAGSDGAAIDARVGTDSPVLTVVATSPEHVVDTLARVLDVDADATIIVTDRAWDPPALDDPAPLLLTTDLLVTRPVREFTLASVGHVQMREALADRDPDDAATFGWAASFPLRDALVAAAGNGDLTRGGVMDALTGLDEVDYRGMLPDGSGTLGAAMPAGQAALRTVFLTPDGDAPTGVRIVDDYYNSTTTGTFAFEQPCAGATASGVR